ncbi:MAG: COX15/CtaA family protein [Gammaproteobacteria bacterium]|nr:COX15/CtaA family protein [Gammaproteobacteria bacterium]
MAGKYSTFEEAGGQGARNAIRLWMMLIFALVAVMIAVGGMTRLTDSGLSITEWRPVTGAVPPLDATTWASEFEKYQAIPEYQLQNKGMTLEEFKTIYWWEWGHRQLGRVIGLVWALGFAGFLVARKIPAGWIPRLVLLGALGGAQGAIGWWMVSSGLSGDRLDVASYRLAVHLGLAFVILGFLAWYVLSLGHSATTMLLARRGQEGRLFGLSTGLMHFAFLQVLLGALVAGIDAGRGFPTWPLMNGQFFPAEAFYVPGRPAWAAFFENAGLVQFMHRVAGYVLFFFGTVVWLRGRESAHPVTRRAFDLMMAMLMGQVLLGIAAVLTAAQMHVAITHQVGAVILWVLILRARHLSQYPRAGAIREGNGQPT